jgi:hypothetical protein
MTPTKKLGIYMDHASAHLTEFTIDPSEAVTISSKFTHEEKEQTLSNGESHMHNAEQHEESQYYKELGKAIRGYDDVLLFGPTDAKTELFNLLRKDHLFAGIKITVKPSDKLTESHQHSFIKEYFAAH